MNTPSHHRTLWEMLQFYADKFVLIVHGLGTMEAIFALKNDGPDDVREVHDIAQQLIVPLEEIGLRLSAKKAKAILKIKFSHELIAAMAELRLRIKDELEDGYFIHLTDQERRLYSSGDISFGTDISNKFPSSSYDIDEAAKCLALGRTTAAVFHLMRVMETGVEAIRKSLCIPDPVNPAKKNWGIFLDKIKNAIAEKTSWEADDKRFFLEAYASLDAVRGAWRNPTMHVEKKYLPHEAEHVFVVVKGFMQIIAARLDEQGQPLA